MPQWQLARWREYMGDAGLAAIVLAICCTGYILIELWPTYQQLEKIQQNIGKPQPQIAAKPTIPPVEAFLVTFPKADSVSVQLQKIFDVAGSYDLDLGEISYKRERHAGDRLQRYQVEFSLEASYPDIRAFLTDLLAALPYVALDQLSITRDDPKSGVVQSHIRLTLFVVSA